MACLYNGGMHIRRLSLHNVRRFDRVELASQPGINLITGDNGAGKTSVLEALHVMAYGRSFRGRVRDGLVRHGLEALDVFVEWDEQRAGAEMQPIKIYVTPASPISIHHYKFRF